MKSELELLNNTGSHALFHNTAWKMQRDEDTSTEKKENQMPKRMNYKLSKLLNKKRRQQVNPYSMGTIRDETLAANTEDKDIQIHTFWSKRSNPDFFFGKRAGRPGTNVIKPYSIYPHFVRNSPILIKLPGAPMMKKVHNGASLLEQADIVANNGDKDIEVHTFWRKRSRPIIRKRQN